MKKDTRCLEQRVSFLKADSQPGMGTPYPPQKPPGQAALPMAVPLLVMGAVSDWAVQPMPGMAGVPGIWVPGAGVTLGVYMLPGAKLVAGTR